VSPKDSGLALGILIPFYYTDYLYICKAFFDDVNLTYQAKTFEILPKYLLQTYPRDKYKNKKNEEA
jgi:hypothetical protein